MPKRPPMNRACSISLRLAAAALLVITGAQHSLARSDRRATSVEFLASRTVGEPVMAIVSLRSQSITVYDSQGWIARSSVSSGQIGRETPAGVFSVLQKRAEHYSNLYDDAYMPHMQRLTWSGIALHGGVLPGYPASHGCVRMPFDFAARLFDMTQLGLRVIVSPTDVAPVEIAHPALFSPKPGTSALAAARAAEAEDAILKANQARLAAVIAAREAARAMVPVRVAENLLARIKGQPATADTALSSPVVGDSGEPEDVSAAASSRVVELKAQLATAKSDLEPKLRAVAPAREAAVVAEAARVAAIEAAREVALDREPISVFISRRLQRLYVRRGFQPLFDEEITIQDTDRPIGTHVFTAVHRVQDSFRWTVVSLNTRSHEFTKRGQNRSRSNCYSSGGA